jgi:hypothetical protein
MYNLREQLFEVIPKWYRACKHLVTNWPISTKHVRLYQREGLIKNISN